MVGAAYAIERNFFQEMGTYDEGMKVWGGENLEMAWRVSFKKKQKPKKKQQQRKKSKFIVYCYLRLFCLI